jgi:hypothetical protein
LQYLARVSLSQSKPLLTGYCSALAPLTISLISWVIMP